MSAMNWRSKEFWTHLAGLVLAALLFLVAGWMFVDAWLAFTQPIVIIEWQTASEMDTLGFNIYRSETSDPAQEIKVNKDLIPPSSDPMLGDSYSFKDNGVRPGYTYYYWLEEVDASGFGNRFELDPVQALRAGWQQGLLGAALLAAAVLVLSSDARSAKTGRGKDDSQRNSF